jgi:hypothetical protein
MRKEKRISLECMKKPTFSQMIRQAEMARKISNRNSVGEYAAACLYLTTVIIKNKKKN